jgi:hypothetical protein
MIFSLKDILAILPEITIVTGACVLLLAALLIPKGEKKDIIAYLAMGFVALAAIDTLIISGMEKTTVLGGMFALDGYACFFKFVFYIGTILSILLSLNYVDEEKINVEEYYILMLFSLSGMMVIASGANLLTIYLGLELMSLPIYVLVGFLQRDIRSNEAAMKYIVLGAFSRGLFLRDTPFRDIAHLRPYRHDPARRHCRGPNRRFSPRPCILTRRYNACRGVRLQDSWRTLPHVGPGRIRGGAHTHNGLYVGGGQGGGLCRSP